MKVNNWRLASFSFPNKLRIDNARPSVQSILLPNAQQLTIVFVLSIPQSFIALLALAVVVLPITLSSPAPLRPSPYKPEPKYEEGPAHNQYAYAVKDEYANLDFKANEERDGYKTTGSYEVLLPMAAPKL
ncbi:hypothetical protein TCAL_14534 [Tigriopus californicus]|uniref:Uncharacterized protein n=1 Tax=Tigriopus californicus TaxID=6832 RepID=A0A553PT73_TIGCA|nr:hypothetical protein TCAL_14534 [Tigriopus californicus]